MTNELSAAAGILLVLIFDYCPGVKTWFEALDKQHKQLVNLACLAGVTVGVFVLSCFGVVNGVLVCTQKGAADLFRAFLSAVVANAGAHVSTKYLVPKPEADQVSEPEG